MNAKRLSAVILDWAGTTVDFGSLAPVRTLERVFAEAGVPILEEEARHDMGIAKRDHIAALLDNARIKGEWLKRHGRLPSQGDGDDLYQTFLPLQFACLREYSNLIAGVPDVVEKLKSRGMKIGSTTGYTRAMLDVLVEVAAQSGYKPDCSFSPEDAGAGRPHPFMIYTAAIKMQVYPLSTIVKVGDTVADIKEGLNAGTWSIGVAATGNGVGLAEAEFKRLSAERQLEKTVAARQELSAAGAHYVVDTLADLLPVLDEIEERLSGKAPD